MYLVIIFSISLTVILILTISKYFEFKGGNKNIITSLTARLDPLSERIFSFFQFKAKQVTQTFRYIALVLIPQKAKSSYDGAKGTAIRKYKENKEVLMGKRDLKSSGASFFLKKMKENKDNTDDGKIEDDSLPKEVVEETK